MTHKFYVELEDMHGHSWTWRDFDTLESALIFAEALMVPTDLVFDGYYLSIHSEFNDLGSLLK